jgi:hypothetical protein
LGEVGQAATVTIWPSVKKIAYVLGVILIGLWWLLELFIVWAGADYMGQFDPRGAAKYFWDFVPPPIGMALIALSVLTANRRVKWGALAASLLLALGSLPWFVGFFIAYTITVMGTA